MTREAFFLPHSHLTRTDTSARGRDASLRPGPVDVDVDIDVDIDVDGPPPTPPPPRDGNCSSVRARPPSDILERETVAEVAAGSDGNAAVVPGVGVPDGNDGNAEKS